MDRAARFATQALISVALIAFVSAGADARIIAAPGGSAHLAKFTPDKTLQDDVNGYITSYEADLHHTLGLTVVAGVVDHEIKTADGSLIYANATALNAKGKDEGPGAPVKCKIQETPLGVSKGPAFESLTMAHELFHCFQFDLRGKDAWTQMPLWVQEGTADWAATTVDPSPFELDSDFLELGKYLNHPRTELFDRSYDASGFWGHLQDVTGDLWKVLPAVIRADDSRAAFVAAGADDGAVLNTWASSYLRNPSGSAGEAWQMHSPMVPPDSNQDQLDSLPTPVLQLHGDGKVWAHPYSVANYHFASMPAGEPLMNVKLHGWGRLSVTHNYTSLSDAWFCVDPQGCKCPPNTTDELPNTRPLETNAYLAVTGDPDDTDGTEGQITFHKLDEFCKPMQQTPPYHNGNAGSGGDPHLNTFDGAFYDFQAAGEFTLMKSTRDDLQIQVRQKPLTFMGDHVAVITAVAIRDGGATIQVNGNGATYLDKHRATFPSTARRLPGGGSVTGGFDTVVRWRDGTSATIYRGIWEGLTVHAARDRRKRLRGLFGPYTGGSPLHDLIGRNGVHYRANPTFGVLYGEYGNSWRITQKQSLFVYPRGKSTRSYTRLRYPPAPITAGRLPPAARAKAKAECIAAGITLPKVLADCELDVGLTNNPGNAAGDLHLQQAALGQVVPTGTSLSHIPWTELSAVVDRVSPTPSVVSAAGGQVVAAFKRFSDQSIEVASFGAGPGGVTGVTRTFPFTSWANISDPVLFAEPGGGVRMIVAGQHSGTSPDPLNGTAIVTRNADGSFGPPTNLSTTNQCCVASATLAADGSTPLWLSSAGYSMLYYDGAVQHDLTSDSLGFPESPYLGRDAAGRMWLAWYAFTQSNADGLYMAELDPQTGAELGPPQRAPNSESAGTVMVCGASCRLVYANVGAGGYQLSSWAPGGPAVTVRAGPNGNGPFAPSAVAAAYTADGRLWVAWADSETRKIYAKLGDAQGRGGQTIEVAQRPPGFATPGSNTATTVGNRLVITTDWGDGQGSSAVWATVVNSPQ